MTIEIIEKELATGQVPPPRLAEMQDYLSALSSSKMDRQNELTTLYAEWFTLNKPQFGSDKATDNAWKVTDAGKEERELKVLQSRITILNRAISRHLRVASDVARNMY